jgi:hypothetical protein
MMSPAAFHVRASVAIAVGLGGIAAAAAHTAAGYPASLGVAGGLLAVLAGLGAAAAVSAAVVGGVPRRWSIVAAVSNGGVLLGVLLLFWGLTKYAHAPAWSLSAGVTAGVFGMLAGFALPRPGGKGN